MTISEQGKSLAEDFSFMLNSRKGAYILLGNGNSSGVHSPTYVFNDELLPIGASFWAELVEARMKIENKVGSK